jgi:hypothetical protein
VSLVDRFERNSTVALHRTLNGELKRGPLVRQSTSRPKPADSCEPRVLAGLERPSTGYVSVFNCLINDRVSRVRSLRAMTNLFAHGKDEARGPCSAR